MHVYDAESHVFQYKSGFFGGGGGGGGGTCLLSSIVLFKTPHGVIEVIDTGFVFVILESFFVGGADSSEKVSVYCWGMESGAVRINLNKVTKRQL